jgi:type IV pilus assembly protein PilV
MLMNRTNMTGRGRQEKGVMLLEALIAILIFPLGILAVVGLQAAMIKNAGDSKYRVDASFLANQAIGQIWLDRPNIANYKTAGAGYAPRDAWENTVAATLPGGFGEIDVDGTTVVVKLSWRAPGQAIPHKYSAVVEIN